ncbi:hypothetical protein LJR296_007963 [Cupriavidus necator]|uniref:hypothetical protein n=1 Tax=Cupriavidus necator TaxID=106590 RepID=UPI003ECF79C5
MEMLTQSYPSPVHGTAEQNTHLPARAYTVLAILVGLVGLAASAVTADFFIIGLLKLEADALARDALVAAGVLMIVAEVLAFSVAALLPRARLASLRRRLTVFGMALLAFEGVTIYATQVALAQAASADAQASVTRVEYLRAAIEGQRASAAALRSNAERQSASQYSWVRTDGAKSLREAVTMEANISRQAAELANLQAAQRPTLTGILGQGGLVAYSVARALLISSVGIMMCAAAGALLQARRSVIAAHATQNTATAPKPQRPVETKVPPLLASGGRYASAVLAPIAVSLAAPALAAPVPVISMPAAPAPKLSQAKPQQQPAQATASDSTPKPKVKRSAMQDSGVGEEDGARFLRVRAAILAGEIKPSQRDIWNAVRASQRVAARYLAAMEAAGELKREGRRHVLA